MNAPPLKNPPRFSKTLILLALLLGAGSGCSVLIDVAHRNISPLQPTPVSENTPQPYTPTSTSLPGEQNPANQEAEATVAPLQPAQLLREAELYRHPDGWLQFYPPKGWTRTEETAGSVWFEAQGFDGAIQIQATNTGYTLNADAFERFVDARDDNTFSVYEAYEPMDREVQKDLGTAKLVKRLSLEGTAQKVVSFYAQHGQAIFVMDFWVDENLFGLYVPVLEELFQDIVVDERAAASQPVYSWVYPFEGTGDLFTLEVPAGWSYQQRVGDYMTVDFFSSPDQQVAIRSIIYDDGEEITRSQVAEITLKLLEDFYQDDVHVTEDRLQPSGSERLTWYSDGGRKGLAFFKTKETTILFLIMNYEVGYKDIYGDCLDFILNSYQTP